MNSRIKLWLFSAAIYALFALWYTDFGGPMSTTEVDNWVEKMNAKGSDPELINYLEGFLRNDTGRQFLMLNAVEMNPNPPHVEGAEPGETADQLMNRYLAHILPELLQRASHPAFLGDAVFSAVDIVGIENAESWDSGALFRYRSRRSFSEILAHPNLGASHDFKIAALNKTIAYPIETSFYLGDPRLILGLLLLAITALLDTLFISPKLSKRESK